MDPVGGGGMDGGWVWLSKVVLLGGASWLEVGYQAQMGWGGPDGGDGIGCGAADKAYHLVQKGKSGPGARRNGVGLL